MRRSPLLTEHLAQRLAPAVASARQAPRSAARHCTSGAEPSRVRRSLARTGECWDMPTRYGQSPWMAAHRAQPPSPRLRGDHEADVVIIGGGLTGTATALACATAGLKPIVVEAGGVGQGWSGHSRAPAAGPGPALQGRGARARAPRGDACVLGMAPERAGRRGAVAAARRALRPGASRQLACGAVRRGKGTAPRIRRAGRGGGLGGLAHAAPGDRRHAARRAGGDACTRRLRVRPVSACLGLARRRPPAARASSSARP